LERRLADRIETLLSEQRRLERRRAALLEHERQLQERVRTSEGLPVALPPAHDGDAAKRREQALAVQERTLAEREQQLRRRVELVTEREQALARRAGELAERERRLSTIETAPAPAEVPSPLPAAPVQAAAAASPPAFAPSEPQVPKLTGASTLNLAELERLVAERAEAFPEDAENWRFYLLSLRDHAAVDGTLPASFAALVDEIFGPLLTAAPRD
jgi:hypothetical protein